MGIKILKLRHRIAPALRGCRWCGFPPGEHADRHVLGHGRHDYTAPTAAQMDARTRARLKLSAPSIGPMEVANHDRTRL